MITITLDPRIVLGALTDLEKQQLPFAIAQSLTRVAAGARVKIQQAMPQVFDRPTPSTISGVMYRKADKRRLDEGSAVFIKSEGGGKSLSPSKWLMAEVMGGPRRDKRLEVALKLKGVMPRGAQTAVSRFAPLDAFGNLKGSFVVQLMSILSLLGETGYAANRTAKSKAIYTYSQRFKTGLQQVMAGSRNFSLGSVTRDDLMALTEESAKVSGIKYVMDAYREDALDILLN